MQKPQCVSSQKMASAQFSWEGETILWCFSPTPTPPGGTPSNRLHWEAVPEKGIAGFWKGDTLCGLKVCERGSTFHRWHMRGLSCPVKPTKSVSRGKRFDVVWEPPFMKLPSDCSWSLLGQWRVTGWTWKTPKKSVRFRKLKISNQVAQQLVATTA